jgi:hypothetical protein
MVRSDKKTCGVVCRDSNEQASQSRSSTHVRTLTNANIVRKPTAVTSVTQHEFLIPALGALAVGRRDSPACAPDALRRSVLFRPCPFGVGRRGAGGRHAGAIPTGVTEDAHTEIVATPSFSVTLKIVLSLSQKC